MAQKIWTPAQYGFFSLKEPIHTFSFVRGQCPASGWDSTNILDLLLIVASDLAQKWRYISMVRDNFSIRSVLRLSLLPYTQRLSPALYWRITAHNFFYWLFNHIDHILQSICILVQKSSCSNWNHTLRCRLLTSKLFAVELRPATSDRLVSFSDQTVPSQDLINTVLDSPSPQTARHLEITPAIHQD